MGTGVFAPAEALAGTDAGLRGVGKEAGAPLASFVPASHRVATRVLGHLGGGSARDAVLVLEERRADARGARGRRLLVLVGRRGADARGRARFTRAGEGRHVLLCTRCGGDPDASGPTPVDVRIRDSEVVVRQQFGRRFVTAQTFRFRLTEARPPRVRLASYEECNRDRRTDRWARARTNLLTGDHVIETWARGAGRTYDAFGDRPREILLEESLQGAPLTAPR
jgi:hypothetical protein